MLARRIRLLLALALTACGPPGEPTPELVPFADNWRTEVEAGIFEELVELSVVGGDGGDGGHLGHLEVRYDGSEGRVRVEVRRFTEAADEDEARREFDRMVVFAATLGPPSDLSEPPAGDCSQAWRDKCQVGVAYDGMARPIRAGADLRITLPPSFSGTVLGHLDDVEGLDDPRPSNLCMDGYVGSAEVRLEHGNARVAFEAETPLSPGCAPTDVAACDAVGWGDGCSCDPGHLQLTTDARTGVTLDLPPALWVAGGLSGECEVDMDLPTESGAGACPYTFVVNRPDTATGDGRAYQIRTLTGSDAQVTVCVGCTQDCDDLIDGA